MIELLNECHQDLLLFETYYQDIYLFGFSDLSAGYCNTVQQVVCGDQHDASSVAVSPSSKQPQRMSYGVEPSSLNDLSAAIPTDHSSPMSPKSALPSVSASLHGRPRPVPTKKTAPGTRSRLTNTPLYSLKSIVRGNIIKWWCPTPTEVSYSRQSPSFINLWLVPSFCFPVSNPHSLCFSLSLSDPPIPLSASKIFYGPTLLHIWTRSLELLFLLHVFSFFPYLFSFVLVSWALFCLFSYLNITAAILCVCVYMYVYAYICECKYVTVGITAILIFSHLSSIQTQMSLDLHVLYYELMPCNS